MTNPATHASTMTRGGMMPSVTDAQRRIADGKGKTMSDMIYTGMHIPTSCSMCWVRGTCEVWAMELHKQRGHGKRLDNCPLRPLVRCKDCMHAVDYYHEGDCYCSNPKWGLNYFGGSWEFYCADAERRNNE